MTEQSNPHSIKQGSRDDSSARVQCGDRGCVDTGLLNRGTSSVRAGAWSLPGGAKWPAMLEVMRKGGGGEMKWDQQGLKDP